MMALDVSKIQEKSKLARDLIQQGIAADFSDACKMIDERGMVKISGMSVVEENARMIHNVHSPKKDNKSNDNLSENAGVKPVESPHLDLRLDKIEKSFSELRDLFMSYAKNNDGNLRELDQKLNDVVKHITQSPRSSRIDDIDAQEVSIAQDEVQETLPKKPERNDSKHPQSHLNPKDFSVMKYFNNAHSRMKK